MKHFGTHLAVACAAVALLMLADGGLMAQSILIDDFNDGNDDGWRGGSRNFDASSGAYHVESANLVPVGELGFLISYWDASSDPFYTDGFWRATIRTETGGTNAALILRHFPGDGTRYLVTTSIFGAISIWQCGGAEGCSKLGSRDVGFGPGEDWVIEAGAVGNILSAKMWRKGDDVPDEPQVMVTNSANPTGQFGVASFIGTNWNEPARVSAQFDDIFFTPAHPVLQAGDADQDLDFNQLDLVQVQVAAKYLSGQPATWGEGDWNGAPGGTAGSPPPGDGLFNQMDIVAAQQAGLYLTGPYAAVLPNGQPSDGQTSIIYNVGTGELAVDTPAGTELTSINIDSATGIFTADAAENLGGSFDNDADNNIFKATFGSSFGSLSFGNVAERDLSEEFLLNDLSVVGSLQGGGDLGEVDLIYVPEPSSLLLTACGLIGLVAFRQLQLSRGFRRPHRP